MTRMIHIDDAVAAFNEAARHGRTPAATKTYTKDIATHIHPTAAKFHQAGLTEDEAEITALKAAGLTHDACALYLDTDPTQVDTKWDQTRDKILKARTLLRQTYRADLLLK